jgi:hypothetical protein
MIHFHSHIRYSPFPHTDKLDLSYNQKSLEIKKELAENIKLNRIFSIILDAWTGINQKAFLGIII